MGFAAFAGFWLAGRDTPAPAALGEFRGFVRPPDARAPAFALRNQDGERVSRPGELTVYAFIYSHCEDTCPLEVQQIRGALDRLGRDVRVLGVSVDPANDTPASARGFLADQFMTGRMEFLLGSRAELQPVWDAFGIAPQRDGKEHSAGIVLVDGDGRQRIGFPASQLTVASLEHDLRRLIFE